MQSGLLWRSVSGEEIQGKEWFDYFSVKPINRFNLFSMLLKSFICTKAIKKNIPNITQSLTKESISIIIAEDDIYNQVLIKEMLLSLGILNIKVVANGKLCVEEIKNNKYDICFMDIKMPVMDGLEACRCIKKFNPCPFVVAVSASVLESDKNKCFRAGMDGYIPKPIQKEQLESTLMAIINRH